jgi:membrane associated rhomboid family serine protease
LTAIKSPTTLKQQLTWVSYIVGFLAIIEVINMFTGRYYLNQFSLYPRELSHLLHIFTAPFLHANFAHFASNIVTLSIFSLLLLQFGGKRFISVSLSLIVMTGLLVWVFGRPSFHLGASGVIYGYFGYLVLAGFLSKRFFLMLISVLVAFFYGGMIWGVLPNQPYISWESHLFGFLAGLCLAWVLRTQR